MSPMSINLAKFVYPETKTTKIIGNFHNYTVKNGGFANLNRGLRTENINTCTAGVLNADKTNFMFHVAPEQQSISTIKKELEKKIETLRETCDDIKAFICGGLELNHKDPESIRSFELYNTIADAFDELGVKFTMMCGKQKGAPMDNIYAVNKSVTMWNDSFKKIFNQDSSKLSKDDILELLENEYQFVESNDAHKLSVLEKFMPKNQYTY